MTDTRVHVEKHYTTAEAAELSGLGDATIKREIAAGNLKAKRKPGRVKGQPGRGYLIPASALAVFLEGLADA